MNYVISSAEIAKIVNMRHDNVLRKIEGSSDCRGVIKYLQHYGYPVEEYLQKTTYIAPNNSRRPCYLFTKLGWHFLINLFTGYRGHLLSDAYVKRYSSSTYLPERYVETCLADKHVET